MPDDPTLRAFYDSADYFQCGETASGYSDYDHQTENVLPFFRGLLERVGLGNGRSMLDIGCAYGTHLALAAKSGWQCYGVEVSAHARRVMRERYGDTIPVVTQVIDLPVRTYDLILLFDVLEHLRDPYRLFFDLAEIDALGSHTKVVVTMPNARSAAALADPAAWVYRTPPEHLVYFSAESLALFFSALGFKRVDISGLSAVDHLGTADRMVTDSYVVFARYDGLSCEATEFHSPSSPLLQAVSVERERMRNDTRRLHESPYLDALFRLLGSEVTQRDQALAAYDRALAERDEQIATLNRAMAERDGQIASLNRAVAERDGRIAGLNQAVAERDGQIASLNQAVAERDGQIGALRRQAAQRRTEAAATAKRVHDLRHQLVLVRKSSSWRLTRPLRASRRLLSRLFAGTRRTARSPTIGIPAVVGPLPGSVSADDTPTAIPAIAERQRMAAPLGARLREIALQDTRATPVPSYTVTPLQPPNDKRPRVVHAIANFMLGGSSRLVVDLIEHLGNAYEQRVITSFIPSPPAYDGIAIEQFCHLNSQLPIIDYLQRYRPSLMHVHYWGESDKPWYDHVFKAAEQYGCKIIENVNTPVEPWLSDKINHYVFVSDYVRTTFGVESNKQSTIYPGSDFSLFAAENAPPDDCIGMVYRLERDKLNENAIAPFIKVAQARPQTKIVIVGGGTYLQPYKQAASAAGVLDCFDFTGYVAYADLPAYYRWMSVFVAPVWKESFGQVLPFAMNMGIPVVGYDVGALHEIIGDAELLAPPGDSARLAQIIIELLDDRERRLRIGRENRQRADKLSVDAMVREYRALYDQLLTVG